MSSTQPTDMGRPREIAVARALNLVMFALLLACLGGGWVWGASREIGLTVQAHGAKLGEHLTRLALLLQPVGSLIFVAVIWRRRSRAA